MPPDVIAADRPIVSGGAWTVTQLGNTLGARDALAFTQDEPDAIDALTCTDWPPAS